jgi:hypothetical protein
VSESRHGAGRSGFIGDGAAQQRYRAGRIITRRGRSEVQRRQLGDQKSWPDCLVANQVARTVAPPENSAGSATNEVLVSLNCDAAAASVKSPGYSAASPEAKAIAAAAKAANSSG